jgi:hypothetical protein
VNTETRSGFHQVSIGHLVMGLAFLGIVGIWALVQSDTVKGDDIRWLLPIPWVVAGVVGLVATAITGPRRYAVRQTGWVGPQADQGELELDDQPEPTEMNDQNDVNEPEETP